MTGFTMQENFMGKEVTYRIYKSGKHAGAIDVTIDDTLVIEDIQFTTAQELSGALCRAQIAMMSRANDRAITTSATATEFAQNFIKNTADYLRKVAVVKSDA